MATGILTFLRYLAVTGGAMVLATFVGVAMTGPSIRAGERTAMALIGIDLALAVLALARFAVVSRTFASGFARLAWTLAFGGALAVGLVVLLFLTLVVLNR